VQPTSALIGLFSERTRSSLHETRGNWRRSSRNWPLIAKCISAAKRDPQNKVQSSFKNSPPRWSPDRRRLRLHRTRILAAASKVSGTVKIVYIAALLVHRNAPLIPARSHAPSDPLQAIHCGVEGMDAKRSAAVLVSSPNAAQRCAVRRRA
jgi:hypothetical protein